MKRQTRNDPPEDIFLEKPMPALLEIEQAVLAQALLAPAVHVATLRDLPRDYFHSERHKLLRDAIVAVDGTPDLLSVAAQLRAGGHLEQVGGMLGISDLIDGHSRVELIDQYVRQLRDAAILRRGVMTLSRGLSEVLGGDATPGTLQGIADQLREGLAVDGGLVPVADKMLDYLEAKERRYETRQYPGVPTGFRVLDAMLGGGLQPGLTVIAARPSGGKTALALDLARHAARAGYAVGLFSMEMSYGAIMDRLVAKETGLGLRRVVSGVELGQEDFRRVIQAAGRIAEWPLYVDDSGALPWPEIAMRTRARRASDKLDLLLCDQTSYIQGQSTATGGRRLEVGSITQGAKLLARELEIPVVLLNQIRRQYANQNQPDPNSLPPRLEELKESGSLEEDADVVVTPWRPDRDVALGRGLDGYYVESSARLCVLKQRQGPTGMVAVDWVRDTATFRDQPTS